MEEVDVRCFVCGRRFNAGFIRLDSGLFICCYCNGGVSGGEV